MDKQAAKWMEELRKDPMYELCDDAEIAAVAERIKREISDYEASARPAGAHWPENLIASVLGLEWVELKKSVGGESVGQVLSAILDTLTPRESKVIELFYKEEKGLIEIAEECKVSYATIRSILAKGSRKLRCPSRAGRLAACIERSDKEPVIRSTRREFASIVENLQRVLTGEEIERLAEQIRYDTPTVEARLYCRDAVESEQVFMARCAQNQK